MVVLKWQHHLKVGTDNTIIQYIENSCSAAIQKCLGMLITLGNTLNKIYLCWKNKPKLKVKLPSVSDYNGRKRFPEKPRFGAGGYENPPLFPSFPVKWSVVTPSNNNNGIVIGERRSINRCKCKIFNQTRGAGTGGQRGQITPRNLPGSNVVFWPPKFLGINIFWCTGQLIFSKIIKVVATSCLRWRLKCTKFGFGGAPPQTTLGELTAPPDL